MSDNPLRLEWDEGVLSVGLDVGEGFAVEDGVLSVRVSATGAIDLWEHAHATLAEWYTDAASARSAVRRGVTLSEFIGAPDLDEAHDSYNRAVRPYDGGYVPEQTYEEGK